MLLERKASSQGLDVGEGAGPKRCFDGVGDFRFAAVFVGQGKEIDGETACLSFAHGFHRLIEEVAISLSRKELIAVGQMCQSHGLALQVLDDVPIIDDVGTVRPMSTRQDFDPGFSMKEFDLVIEDASLEPVADESRRH